MYLWPWNVWPEGAQIRQLRVEYRNSAVYGDTIYPVYHQEEDLLKVSLNDSDGKPYAIVEFQLAPLSDQAD